MFIIVNIGDDEYTVPFQAEEHLSGMGWVRWRGELPGLPGAPWVAFTEVDGTVQDVELSPQIANPKEQVYERVVLALEKVRETEAEGFETDETTEEADAQAIVNPYNPDDIKVRRDIFPVSQIYDMIENQEDIDLNPDFQRHLVWDAKRKSRLIESILLGIPLPVFYFSQDNDGLYHVVDGLQRLSTIRDFMSNRFPLKSLEHLKKYENLYYKATDSIKAEKALERRFQRRIEQTQLNVNVIEASSPPKVKYDIFRRINEGGRPLNQQEIRNCLAKTHVRKFLRNAVALPSFVQATGGTLDKDKKELGISDQRMGAQELVLRFAGFLLPRQDGMPSYAGNMNDFLDEVLELLNRMRARETDQLLSTFDRAMQNCYHAFGRFCFRKYLPENLQAQASRQLFNKSLYVTWSVVLEPYETGVFRDKVAFESFAHLLASALKEDEEYYRVVTNKTSDRSSLQKAFQKAEALFNAHYTQKNEAKHPKF